MTEFAKSVANEAHQTFILNGQMHDMAKFICDKFEHKYHNWWNCVVNPNNHAGKCIRPHPQHYIYLTIDQLVITIWQNP